MLNDIRKLAKCDSWCFSNERFSGQCRSTTYGKW